MLVIVSVSRFDGNAVSIHVARPQHDSKARQEYPSQKDAWAILSAFGISEREIVAMLKLLEQAGANQKLTFAPLEVAQHELRARGFHLQPVE